MCARASESGAPRDAGFTLLEALVTLLIVGLLAGAVALSAPSPDARARGEAERLAARLVLAGDESVLRNRVVGLMMTDQGYGFGRLEATGWAPVQDAGPLRYRALPPGITATVVEGEASADAAVVARFDPLGAATPLTVAVEGGGGAFTIVLSANGGVRVEPAS